VELATLRGKERTLPRVRVVGLLFVMFVLLRLVGLVIRWLELLLVFARLFKFVPFVVLLLLRTGVFCSRAVMLSFCVVLAIGLFVIVRGVVGLLR